MANVEGDPAGRPADPARRRLLAAAVAAVATAAAPGGARAAPRVAPVTRIGFGSCAHQSRPQPVWDAINALAPEWFIMLGDNVYGDTRDPRVLREAYAALAAVPGFRRLRSRTGILATWDDHDYGENDAGADYPMKEASRRIFCDFWGEPADSPRRRRDGIYTSRLLGPPGRQVQLLLPDLRWNRTPLRRRDLGGRSYDDWADAHADAGRDVPGPYEREPSRAATMLGERQWAWLEQELARPAEVRLLCSSLQVVADFPGWEAWINYARDHQRLIEAIRRRRAHGLVALSGDTHYGEISRLDVNVPYPLWDFTSSGLTEVWPVRPPNALRQRDVVREVNFGWIELDWSGAAPRATVQIRDVGGRVRLEQRLDFAQLRVR